MVLRMRASEGMVREAPDPNSAVLAAVRAVLAAVRGGTRLKALAQTRAWYLVEPHEAADGRPFARGHVSAADVEWAVNCVVRTVGAPGQSPLPPA